MLIEYKSDEFYKQEIIVGIDMKKRKLPPDNRKDWRDKDMPVTMLSDGRYVEVPPNQITNYYKAKLEQIGWSTPNYKNDPSYWWSKKSRKS